MSFLSLAKIIGKGALMTVSNKVTKEITGNATPALVERLRMYLKNFCRDCYTSTNKADDLFADFLVEIFDLEMD